MDEMKCLHPVARTINVGITGAIPSLMIELGVIRWRAFASNCFGTALKAIKPSTRHYPGKIWKDFAEHVKT